MPNSDAERIAKLEAKLDTLIESFEKRMDRLETSLSSSYVPRAEYEQRCQNIEQRLERVETGPQRWYGHIISTISLIISVLVYVTVHLAK